MSPVVKGSLSRSSFKIFTFCGGSKNDIFFVDFGFGWWDIAEQSAFLLSEFALLRDLAWATFFKSLKLSPTEELLLLLWSSGDIIIGKSANFFWKVIAFTAFSLSFGTTGFGTCIDKFSLWHKAIPRISGGDVIFGDGGNGETDSGNGVVGNGDIIGVRADLCGDGGIGDNGGEGDKNILGLKDLVLAALFAGDLTEFVGLPTAIVCLLFMILALEILRLVFGFLYMLDMCDTKDTVFWVGSSVANISFFLLFSLCFKVFTFLETMFKNATSESFSSRLSSFFIVILFISTQHLPLLPLSENGTPGENCCLSFDFDNLFWTIFCTSTWRKVDEFFIFAFGTTNIWPVFAKGLFTPVSVASKLPAFVFLPFLLAVNRFWSFSSFPTLETPARNCISLELIS